MEPLVCVEKGACEGVSEGREPWQRGCGETFNAHNRIWPGLKSLAAPGVEEVLRKYYFQKAVKGCPEN